MAALLIAWPEAAADFRTSVITLRVLGMGLLIALGVYLGAQCKNAIAL